MELYEFSQFTSPTPDDLWALMRVNTSDTRANNIKIKDIMKSWIKNYNYPVVQVNREEKQLVLRQYKFDLGDTNKEVSRNNWIPITFTSSTKLNFNITTTCWMTPYEDLVIPINNTDEWIILNLQQTGEYN